MKQSQILMLKLCGNNTNFCVSFGMFRRLCVPKLDVEVRIVTLSGFNQT